MPLCIAEGIFGFYNSNATLIDLKILLHADYETLRERRAHRKGYETTEGYWKDPPNYFEQLVWPSYLKWNQHLLTQLDPILPNQVLQDGTLVLNTALLNHQDMLQVCIDVILTTSTQQGVSLQV